MKKIEKNIIPKIVINQIDNAEQKIYKKAQSHLEYVFDEEDVLKMSQMKFKEDVIAYKQDLILKNKFRLVRKPNED